MPHLPKLLSHRDKYYTFPKGAQRNAVFATARGRGIKYLEGPDGEAGRWFLKKLKADPSQLHPVNNDPRTCKRIAFLTKIEPTCGDMYDEIAQTETDSLGAVWLDTEEIFVQKEKAAERLTHALRVAPVVHLNQVAYRKITHREIKSKLRELEKKCKCKEIFQSKYVGKNGTSMFYSIFVRNGNAMKFSKRYHDELLLIHDEDARS